MKSEGKLTLFSKRGKSFDRQFPDIVEALADLPDNTVVDGEVVALDESGRPDFNRLQNFRAAASHIHYFVFDLLIHTNRDLTHLPLMERRGLMRTVLKFQSPRIHISDYFEASPADMLRAVREQGLEGVVAKQRDSIYEAGKRTGAWIKYRVNRGQEFVIGGYIPGPHGLDSIIVGYYREEDLVYVARVRNGLVPASRRQAISQAASSPGLRVPIRQPARVREGTVGRGINGRRYEEVHLGQAGARGANRVPGMDGGRPSTTL